MARTREFIVMKETSGLPDPEACDNVQKRNFASKYVKYILANMFHLFFLLCFILLLLWFLLDYPDRIEILKKCNEDNKIWNPNNQRWDLNEEEKAWTPYMFWEKAYDNIIRLESFYFRRNETAYNETENSLVKIIYDIYDVTAINAATAIIKPAMNQAFDQWESEFIDLKNCAHEYIEIGDYSMTKAYVLVFIILYSVIFVLSLFAREIFLRYFVKKEFNAAEWKKQSRKNIFFITLAVFISFVFIVYLILLLNRRRSDLNGILSRYWAF